MVPQVRGASVEEVRFTFERLSDHAIAARHLEIHLDQTNPKASFVAGTPLHQVVAQKDAYARAGVIEALAIQLPERTGIELLDALPLENRNWFLNDAFRQSLLWRSQIHFTNRTLQLVNQIGDTSLTLSTLISIATETDNKFNAWHLHNELIKKPLPERDSVWSTLIAELGGDENGPIETLILWAWTIGQGSITTDQAELAAITITWFLTTTNRFVRDRATKALANLLAPRLDLSVSILDRFKNVDDEYVIERLLAAIYGAAMQGLADDAALTKVANAIYCTLFAHGMPPVNALIRDHGCCLIEYAITRNCLPSNVDLTKSRPPYKSPWPIEPVSDATIEGYTEEYSKGTYYTDRITNSAVKDGDFARYVIDSHVKEWSPAVIGTSDLPTDEDMQKAWLAEFEEHATPAMKEAYAVLVKAGEAAVGEFYLSDSPEAKDRAEAEVAFCEMIGPAAWEDFRVRAQSWTRQGMFQFWPSSNTPARFNLAWARRWVCKRAHELGWSDKLHKKFDNSHSISSNRNGHVVERIGKKYQWLALYELGARMADNLAFIGSNELK